ncbi:hypothetical protein LPMP_051170 [Leishmania panamensis]|uniref:Uncharacterized protein n=1 Tax=Leishmania panamensis TaxID=5679 RepID=A0A088RI35_LEIPA|nr:hypothetical protein LPMP_051170 [Leishmania panamensis]AIN95558.1 hypothetical protein LPMP_051170 [Leishmania panamensis]
MNKKQMWANAHSQLWTSPVARSAGSRTQSEASSIASPNRDRSLLDADVRDQLLGSVHLQESSHNAYQPNDKTLVQVSDILESYGAIACDADIPAVLLEVVKELEHAKRENNFKDLLLREYSDAARRRFSLYGEESPPSIAQVSARLREGTSARPVVTPSPAWLEEPLNELRHTIRDVMQACFEKNLDLSPPMLLPEARRTKENVSQLLHASCDALSQLAKEYATAKTTSMKKMESTTVETQSFRQLTPSSTLAELKAQRELTESAAEEGGTSAMGNSHTVGSTLQSIIDIIPASLQIHFNLQVPEAPVLTRCSNLTKLIRFLLSEYLSMERYMEVVEAERQRLAEVFCLSSSPQADVSDANGDLQLDEALSRSLQSLQRTVTSVVSFPHHISEEEIALRHSSTQAVEELAQLLVDARRGGSVSGSCVPHSIATVRVEPPTRNLLEMVELVKSRFATVLGQQQRKELAGAQGRVGLAHMEESMTKHGKQVVQLLRDLCVPQEDAAADSEASEQLLSEVMGNADLERNLTPAKLDHFLSDVVERLRVVKTKYQRALQGAAAGKARAEAASQKSTGLQRRLQKVAAAVERIGRDGLGLSFPTTTAASGTVSAGEANDTGKGCDEAEGGGRGDGISALRRLNLRPALEPATAAKVSSATTTKDSTANEANILGAAVTEHNVLEALQLVASRIGVSGEVRDWAAAQEELAQLRAGEERWKADTVAFHEVMAMLMQRLAKNGQMVKQTLFLMGTDESAKDELVEEVLRRGGEERMDDLSAEATEYVERTLAELLQKYNRWAQRLQQTTEDHLYTQRKIVKYFAAVCRFFASPQSRAAAAAALPEDTPEDNLYDIDSCLMRAADVILPALDAAIQAAAQDQRPTPATATLGTPATLPPLAPSFGDTVTSGATSQQETLVQLARDSTAAATGGVLPYDHRIARLYETVARLYTAVTSLLQVHYLSIPSASRRRSSGETELVFDGDAQNDGFVDIDLDRLIRVSQQRSAAAGASTAAVRRDGDEREQFSREEGRGGNSTEKTPAPSPTRTIAANNDVILRVAYQNMEVVQDTLKRFSANHKMAAIVLQKDVDAMQQLLADMLEKYSEVDMEGAFGQSRDTLHELYVTLRDRGQRQKGCYFFNRVGGEGSCTWVTALEQLADGFRGVVDRLVQRTTLAVEYRRLADEVVDVCVAYMNWAEHRTLPASHALSPELLALCVRNDSEGTTKPDVVTAKSGQIRCLGDDVEASTKPASGGTIRINATATTVAEAAAHRPPKPSRTPPLTPRASNREQQERQQQQAGQEEGAAAPTAASTAKAKVYSFTSDGAVLKVMAHMFQLAQLVVDSSPATDNKTGDVASSDTDATVQQLTEEMQRLRKAVAIAEHHVGKLTNAKHAVELERDQAQSEAAVARAELRRWKRQQCQQHEQQQGEQCPSIENRASVHSPPRSPGEAASTCQLGKAAETAEGVGTVLDEATVKKVMEYMRVLSEELQTAKRQVSGSSVRAHEFVRSSGKTSASLTTNDVLSKNYTDVGQEEEDSEGNEDAPYGASHSHHHHRTYAKLAKQLRHHYNTTATTPMVVIDPQTYSYSSSQRRYGCGRDGSSELSNVQSRYSPIKYRGPAYDACDRYYTRELTQRPIEEGESAELRWCYSGIDARYPAIPTTQGLPGSASALTSQHHLPREPPLDAAPPSVRNLDVYHLGSSRNSAAAAPQRRYPRRLLSRDEPLLSRGPAAASANLASPHAHHIPQRVAPVAAAAASSHPPSLLPATPGTRQRSSVNALFAAPMATRGHPHRSHCANNDNRTRCADMHEAGGADEDEEVFYDADKPRAQTRRRWSTPSWTAAQPHRRPSAARVSSGASRFASSALLSPATAELSTTRDRLGSPHKQSAQASNLSQQHCPVVRGGCGQPSGDMGESLVAAVRQIGAATKFSTSTPTRRGAQAGSGPDASHEISASVPPGSEKQRMSRNTNLRAAALRRLAEVVSQTVVPSTRRG